MSCCSGLILAVFPRVIAVSHFMKKPQIVHYSRPVKLLPQSNGLMRWHCSSGC